MWKENRVIPFLASNYNGFFFHFYIFIVINLTLGLGRRINITDDVTRRVVAPADATLVVLLTIVLVITTKFL